MVSHDLTMLFDLVETDLESVRKTSIGTGYDLQNSVFSPDGRNFQVCFQERQCVLELRNEL